MSTSRQRPPSNRKPPTPKASTSARSRAVVTGSAGALGQLLVRKLHRTHEVIGVDRRPFIDRPKDVEHHRIDLRRKSAFLLVKQQRPDAILHLGVMHNPRKEMGAEAFHYNLDVMSQVLRLCEQLEVKKFVFLSTANLYGASATSSGFLTEEAPLLGAGKSPGWRDLISLDMMVQSFFWKHPEIETVVLRPVNIVGPHLRNAPSKYLRKRTIPTILGFDPMIQLIHELDVIDALVAALRPGVRGIFNLTGAGQAPLSRLIEARGARQLPLPEPLIKLAVDRAFRLRLSSFPAEEIDFLKYSCLVDGSRAHTELSFAPRHSLRATVRDA
ncbi:MAG: NAD-dependent epimerase/dehydratase family protein [Myxococcota bacterium]